MVSSFARELEDRIRKEYHRRGDRLGWRLLYSPEACLDIARVAFLGMNPGGNRPRPEHDEFAMSRGSAYVIESWKESPPGCSKLQNEVRALFGLLKERPEDVLAGNLVPFRSPNWRSLRDPQGAINFGRAIWREILATAQPQIIIAMGKEVRQAVKPLVGADKTRSILLNWGQVDGERGRCRFGVFVGLPYLGRFPVVSREESRPAIRELLKMLPAPRN